MEGAVHLMSHTKIVIGVNIQDECFGKLSNKMLKAFNII